MCFLRRITVSFLTSHLAGFANSFGNDEQRSFWHSVQCGWNTVSCAETTPVCLRFGFTVGTPGFFLSVVLLASFLARGSHCVLPSARAVVASGFSLSRRHSFRSQCPGHFISSLYWHSSPRSVHSGTPVSAFRRYTDFTVQNLSKIKGLRGVRARMRRYLWDVI